ncbi:MAG TPA: hypothetical protein VMA55_14500 [Acidovorax sp.]|nr:hypothetical protein [Acidovorax sp.]
MKRELRVAVYAIADQVASDAAISITNGSISGKNHQPSAPGTPPNNDTGVLMRSIHVKEIGPLVAHVIADAPYAAIQELGGSTGTAVLPERPYMRPAAKKNKAGGVRLLAAAVDKALKGGKFT